MPENSTNEMKDKRRDRFFLIIILDFIIIIIILKYKGKIMVGVTMNKQIS